MLNFKNDILNAIVIEFLSNPGDDEFGKTYNILKAKYGEPINSPIKNSSYKLYTWKEGENRLMLKPLTISFIVKYYKETTIK